MHPCLLLPESPLTCVRWRLPVCSGSGSPAAGCPGVGRPPLCCPGAGCLPRQVCGKCGGGTGEFGCHVHIPPPHTSCTCTACIHRSWVDGLRGRATATPQPLLTHLPPHSLPACCCLACPPATLPQCLLELGGYTYLDVRPALEVEEAGSVQGCVHVPLVDATPVFDASGGREVEASPNAQFLEQASQAGGRAGRAAGGLAIMQARHD